MAHPELVFATVVGVSILLMAGPSALKSLVIARATAALDGDHRRAATNVSAIKANRMAMATRRRS